MDYKPPGFSAHGILQARIVEWVAISSFRGSSLPRDRTHISYVSFLAGGFFTAELTLNAKKVKHVCSVASICVRLCVTSWTVAHQAPLSMGFSRQEYGSGLQFSSPGDLPNPGIEPEVSSVSSTSWADSLPLSWISVPACLELSWNKSPREQRNDCTCYQRF